MKQITKRTLVVFCCALFLSAFKLSAQTTPCGTTEIHLEQMQSDPVYRRNYLMEQERLAAIDKREFANGYKSAAKSATTNSDPLYVIPVVFHIIHDWGIENISDEQCRDGIRTLNEDFRKRNADTVNTIAAFKPIAADCQIEFRLATIDPNGNPTNGIERIQSRFTTYGTDSSKLNPWPRAKYMNVWIVRYVTGGFAAYATYPGGAAARDGILSLHSYIGAIGTSNLLQSHTFSHEVAHYLNIQHVWGNTNSPEVACGDDLVSDTPITKGHNNKCPLGEQVCAAGVTENLQNFMEYSYCYTMFTNGQKNRMHAALTSSVSDRNNLWTVNNLLATGVTTPPQLTKADFKSNLAANSICQNGSLTFKDNSWNGRPTSWSWKFEGGTPATSTDSVPVVTYSTPGSYDVELTVSNTTGTVSEIKKDFVNVTPTVGLGDPYLVESFETDTLPNQKWRVGFNAPGNTWKQTDVASVSGSHSAMIQNTTNSNTYYDDLISQPIDMTKITGSNLVFAFKEAYAKRTDASADKMEIYFSGDCGRTWDIRKSISAAKLTSVGLETGNYIPTPSQWLEQTVPISASYATRTNLLFKIRFVGGNGNNVYVDDIYITGSLGVAEDLLSKVNLNIYPNPVKDNSVVSFDLEGKGRVVISVKDVVGKEVTKVIDTQLNSGHHQYAIGDFKLASGIYFINFSLNNQSTTMKFVVNE